jgi:hypothetical protein
MLLKPRFPKPASLKVHTRLEPLRLELAEIKCGLTAKATGAAVMRSTRNAVVPAIRLALNFV